MRPTCRRSAQPIAEPCRRRIDRRLTALGNTHGAHTAFLINHSAAYAAAAVLSWAEFWLEVYWLPELKRPGWVSLLGARAHAARRRGPPVPTLTIACTGLALVIAGETIRKLAMLTAKSNFTHIVQHHRQPGHVLVTHGIYAYAGPLCRSVHAPCAPVATHPSGSRVSRRLVRHPAYVGWFYWCLGTQLLLQNPISFVGYLIAAHRFFADRI